MSQKNKHGPCGYPLHEIIAMANRFGEYAATFGLTDPDDLNDFCTNLGRKLTEESHRLEIAHGLSSYEHRLKRVLKTFLKAFASSDLLPACRALGPYRGPMPDEARLTDACRTYLTSFSKIHTVLGVSVSETLDLLAWIQCVLSLRILFEQCPELIVHLMPEPARKRGCKRRKRH